MAEEKCISKIRLDDSLFNIKDEELREDLEKLIGSPNEELNTEANGD